MPRREQPGESKSFEAALASLERVVRELERGDLPLEKSLELFEQGVRLSRECQERLNAADRRIEVLLRDGGGRTSVTPFEGDEFGRAPEAGDEAGPEDDGGESVF
ncbi:MAG TPA: exodeoxyribonuclease VII small subunit [Pyrinomonadaceae bacterium]|nr:exodeoxyribonuclease VII small subunit [Pyrinomonadaceae bacterium]